MSEHMQQDAFPASNRVYVMRLTDLFLCCTNTISHQRWVDHIPAQSWVNWNNIGSVSGRRCGIVAVIGDFPIIEGVCRESQTAHLGWWSPAMSECEVFKVAVAVRSASSLFCPKKAAELTPGGNASLSEH